MTWERLEEKRACRIKYEKEFDSYNEENWDEIIEFMIQNMQKLEKSMKEIIYKISLELK
ncbi:DUF4268 domain-containing protein [Campylobacter lari]|nr:DUF4268 domain-containing protein [Campylobacter lari]